MRACVRACVCVCVCESYVTESVAKVLGISFVGGTRVVVFSTWVIIITVAGSREQVWRCEVKHVYLLYLSAQRL